MGRASWVLARLSARSRVVFVSQMIRTSLVCHRWSSVCLLTILPRAQCGLTVSGSTVGELSRAPRQAAGVMSGHLVSVYSREIPLLVPLISSPVTGQNRLGSGGLEIEGPVCPCTHQVGNSHQVHDIPLGLDKVTQGQQQECMLLSLCDVAPERAPWAETVLGLCWHMPGPGWGSRPHMNSNS